ncbi:uncharacterized protein K02A2.6-like [Wyeomyia smithii]|uniref:uncharacterized protein K02A2.6-like n=1 Tax=Wyeomyia smithii TaxID=174621 RepID=UPI0024680D70|nr:uncharacterized protein K02A2.6-like [Wyeomyia smithii]
MQLDSDSNITIISKQNWINVGEPRTSPPDCSDLMNEFGLWDVPFSSFCKLVGSKQPNQQVVDLKANFLDVFTSCMGRCTKTQIHLTLKPDAQPELRPKRPVFYNMEVAVEDELKLLVNLGIITPVTLRSKPTRFHCRRIDPSDAHLLVELDEESRKFVTINTHKGLYRFNRLSPGVKCAPDLDNILVGGSTVEEHNQNLNCVLQRRLLDTEGIRLHPDQVKANVNMPHSHDVPYLDAINYYGKYVREMRTLCQPLDELLEESTSGPTSLQENPPIAAYADVL